MDTFAVVCASSRAATLLLTELQVVFHEKQAAKGLTVPMPGLIEC
jgi:hypothetical protein